MIRGRCLVVGTGRMAGGFVVPLLRGAGWETVLAGRDRSIVGALAGRGGLWLRIDRGAPAWVDGLMAVELDAPELGEAVATADLIATAVGPGALASVGRRLAPLLMIREEVGAAPLNILTFENHRRAPELLAAGLLDGEPRLAPLVGRRLGMAGAAVWRAISHRELSADGVHYEADSVDECSVDGVALVAAPPADGSVPGVRLVRCFDDWMVEKLWLFNAGHAAAAYLGWLAGRHTVGDAMADQDTRALVARVVAESAVALSARHHIRPPGEALPKRDPEWILSRYASPELADPVSRVGREPRRKLAPGDRLIGPAVSALAAGVRPAALATAAAAALLYAEPGDGEATDLQREVDLLGPEETLEMVSGLYATEDLSRLIGGRYRALAAGRSSVPVLA